MNNEEEYRREWDAFDDGHIDIGLGEAQRLADEEDERRHPDTPSVDYDGYLFDEEEDLPDFDEEPDDEEEDDFEYHYYDEEEEEEDFEDSYDPDWPMEGYCFCGEKLNEDGTCPRQ